ncbi:MAG: hypothetical protein AAGD10_07240 [Myxococcota bacterium]
MKRTCLLFLGLFACGDADGPPAFVGREVLEVRLDARGSSQLETCPESRTVEALEAAAFPSDGSPQITLPADCRTSEVDLSILEPGVYDVEVLGLGFLRGLANQVLYGGATRLEVPGTGQLVLVPEVAFVEVAWTPPAGVDLCAENVDQISILVESEDSATPLRGSTNDCGSRGFKFNDPVRPGAWRVSIEGSRRGQVRFARAEERILDAGLNELELALAPSGARLSVDWSFGGANGTNRGCDLAQVEEVDIDVRYRGEVHPFTFPCAAERPRPLDELLLPTGAVVQLQARAEGAALYRGEQSFTVDRLGDFERLIQLSPFGQADVRWALDEQCADSETLAVRIADADLELVFETMADAQDLGLVSPELPFGRYFLSIGDVEAPGCDAGIDFYVDAAFVELEPVVVGAPR